jgi:broad specificity phosphatase PhoE
LADIAKTNGGTALAVSHSTYLRTLLGAIMDVSLAKAATMEQKNGCINVLDINVEGATAKLGPKSGLFGGSLSPVTDFELVLPETHIKRMNEFRHLEGVTWPTTDTV